MRLLEDTHKVAKIECFARSRTSFKDRKAINSLLEFPDKILMPFCATAAVMEAERFIVEDRFGRQRDGVAVDAGSILLDQVKLPTGRSGGFEVSLAKLRHKPFRFHRRGTETNDPVPIGINKCPGTELKSEIIPFLRSAFGVFKRKIANGSEQDIGIFLRRPIQVP